MNENPRMVVARGSREARVFVLLKMSKHTKIMRTSARDIRTASNFATIEPTSYRICHFIKSGNVVNLDLP